MLAWRNLWRNHRRTAIMLGAISVGAWAMIFMTALTQGMVAEMIRDGISALPGHIQVHHPDYRDDPNITNLLPQSYDSRGVTRLGSDPAAERGMIFVDYEGVDGRFLASASDRGVVLGHKLADTLDTALGKRIVLMSQDPDNNVADRGFRIVGLYNANVEAFEETYVFAGRQTIQEMLKIGDRVTEVVVLGDDYRDVEDDYARVIELVDGRVEVKRWTELDTYLSTMMSVMDGFVLIWVVVIFLALSFGLVNTLVMAVFERVREIGLMLALGMKPGNILGQILIESMLLLVIGLGIGNLLAWLTIKPLESGIDISIVAEGMAMMGASSMLYPELRMEDVVLANVVVLILGFLASLSPAWRASRYEPIEAITKVD
jgi:ABC-type lipoprotein release transport system permease subunit